MAKQKFELNICEFDLNRIRVSLSVGEPGEGRKSGSSLKMTATQLSVLAKALGAKKSDVEIMTGLAGGARSEPPEDIDTGSDSTGSASPVSACDDRPVEEDETAGRDVAIGEAVEPGHADDAGLANEPAGEPIRDDIADDRDHAVTGSADAEPADVPGDGGEDDAYPGNTNPEEDYADDIEAEEEFTEAAGAGGQGDRNRDIFDDPDIDLKDPQDLKERYLAARLRDGEGLAPRISDRLDGLRQGLEAAIGIGDDSDETRPKVRRGSRNPLVRDLIRRHIRNRGWE